MQRLPQFLIVGAPKAGTTSLAADLQLHPEVWIPRRKELGYFDFGWRRESLDGYASAFDDAPVGAVVGEATPTYFHVPGALERIRETVPDVRLIAILRDPVARFWSHYWYNRSARRVEDRSPSDAIGVNPLEYIEPGRYGAHLRRARELFQPDQLQILLLDDLVKSPDEVYRSVCRHIGVVDVVPAGVGEVRNAAYALRSLRLRNLMLRLRLWRRLPFDLGYRIDEWNRTPLQTPPIPDELRAHVAALYATDTDELEDLLGRSVPWGSSRTAPDREAGSS